MMELTWTLDLDLHAKSEIIEIKHKFCFQVTVEL